MDYRIQLLSLAVSFVYGVFLTLLVEVNYRFISGKKKILQNFLTLLFIIDIVLLYLIMMYKINSGVVHVYFILLVIFGYVMGYRRLKVLSRHAKNIKFIAKYFIK